MPAPVVWANLEWVTRLGADVVIDYRKDAFEELLHDYDVVLSSLGGDVLDKSLRVLKPGGKLISISGPPDPAFSKAIESTWILRLVMRLLSYRIKSEARRQHVDYSFLFMRASGDQLREIGSLASGLHPVAERIDSGAEGYRFEPCRAYQWSADLRATAPARRQRGR